MSAVLARRDFLKGSGVIAITIGAAGLPALRALSAQASGPYPDPDFLQLDSWIVIHPDNTATFYVGKTDGGQGTGTAYRQMMCDELDIAYDQTSLVMGVTDITPDQGGSGGSDGVERDGTVMRRVAAEARRVLLDLGGQHFNVPVEMLTVANATVALKSDASRKVTFADLIGGKQFNVALTGRNVDAATGKATVKPVNELRVVGQPIARYDIPGKVLATTRWAVDMKLPGMVHARNVRPAFAGATLVAVDESSVANVPGFIRVVSRGNYVAVVCEREEQAIQAARQLKVEWKKPATAPFPASDKLFEFIRSQAPAWPAPAATEQSGLDPYTRAARKLEAEYEMPYQGHCSIGPAHAMADPSNGQMTIYSNDMKAYGLRNGVATFLDMPRENVRVVYMDGPQVYGRTAADDAGFEAAFLAKEIGRPVRMQWMRDEETAWDTKGPPYVFRLRGALDAAGKVTAVDYDATAIDNNHLGYNEPDTVLVAQLMGRRPQREGRGSASAPSSVYALGNFTTATRSIALPQIWETPLRTGNLRDPNGPQVTFAFESFIDELASAANADPVQFRLAMMTSTSAADRARIARSRATLEAAAKAFGWDTRPSPRPRAAASRGNVMTGRGVAFTIRSNTIAVVIAEVEVNRDTGRVWAKRMVCAHDCGLVINPMGLKHTVECGMLHGLSRALWEEVSFNEERVTSVDWGGYSTLRHSDTPEHIEVVLVNGDPEPNRPDLAPYGAGECSHKPVIAAVANAIFDATGVRIRRAPFRPERVKAALAAAQT